FGDKGIEKCVWFTYRPTSNGLLLVRTCGSDFNTVLKVYTGPCDALSWVTDGEDDPAVCGGGNDYASFVARAFQTYYIVAGGYNGASGTLRIVAGPRLPISPPVLSVSNLHGLVWIRFRAESGVSYRLEASTNLLDWLTVLTATTLS